MQIRNQLLRRGVKVSVTTARRVMERALLHRLWPRT